ASSAKCRATPSKSKARSALQTPFIVVFLIELETPSTRFRSRSGASTESGGGALLQAIGAGSGAEESEPRTLGGGEASWQAASRAASAKAIVFMNPRMISDLGAFRRLEASTSARPFATVPTP